MNRKSITASFMFVTIFFVFLDTCVSQEKKKENESDKNQPAYAQSLSDLALHQQSKQASNQESQKSQSVLDIVKDSLEKAASVQSQSGQLAMQKKNRHLLDNALSQSKEQHQDKDAIYNEQLAWKGMTTNRQRQMRLIENDPQITKIKRELESVATKLSKMSQNGLAGQDQEAFGKRLMELTKEYEQLQAELSSKSAEFRKAIEPVNVKKIKEALPQDAVLVDFMEFHYSSLDQNQKGKIKWKRVYSASVIAHHLNKTVIKYLGPSEKINQCIEEWRKDFGSSVLSIKAGFELRKLIWDKIEPHLGDCKTVIVCPDGRLGSFPLAALPGKQLPGSGKSGKQAGTYLIEEYKFARIPYPSILIEYAKLNVAEQQSPSMLLMGGMDYGKPLKQKLKQAEENDADLNEADLFRLPIPRAWQQLPRTSNEVQSICSHYVRNYNKSTLTMQTGSTATEKQFRTLAPKYRILHVATHGFYVSDEYEKQIHDLSEKNEPKLSLQQIQNKDRIPFYNATPGMLSGLVFAGVNDFDFDFDQNEPNDGILTAAEVETLDLSHVDLAVLSASKTALGKVAGGEGMLGLQRSFQIAGARSTVASLWDIDNEATRLLMVRFYENMFDKKMSKLDALHEAQLWILNSEFKKSSAQNACVAGKPNQKNALPPKLWAAFVLSGNWK